VKSHNEGRDRGATVINSVLGDTTEWCVVPTGVLSCPKVLHSRKTGETKPLQTQPSLRDAFALSVLGRKRVYALRQQSPVRHADR